MSNNSNGKTKVLLWAIGIFVVIAMSATGYSLVKIDTTNESLRTDYVQKEDYRRDITELKDAIKELGYKMDRVLER